MTKIEPCRSERRYALKRVGNGLCTPRRRPRYLNIVQGQIGPTNLVHRNYIREVGKIEQNCVRFEQFHFPFNGHAAVDNASDPSVDTGLFSVILL